MAATPPTPSPQVTGKRRRLNRVQWIFLVSVLAVVVLITVYLLPMYLATLYPPGPPESETIVYVSGANETLEPGLNHARAFGFMLPPPPDARDDIVCRDIFGCPWTWVYNDSWIASFNVTSCSTGANCEAYVGIFWSNSWWEFVNGTSTTPNSSTSVFWCAGNSNSCELTHGVHDNNLEWPVGQFVMGVWTPSISPTESFRLSFVHYSYGYWAKDQY